MQFQKCKSKNMVGLAPKAENPAAALRVAIGGISIAVGIIAVYCKDFPVDQDSILLVDMGTGFIVIIEEIISMKFRGFSSDNLTTCCYVYYINNYSVLVFIIMKTK